jgi:hypothetical protein
LSHANYCIVKDEPGEPLVIQDVGPHNKYMTVTNDVEFVVEELVRNGRLEKGRRLLYYDSEDALDEIEVRNGKFVGFKPLREGA